MASSVGWTKPLLLHVRGFGLQDGNRRRQDLRGYSCRAHRQGGAPCGGAVAGREAPRSVLPAGGIGSKKDAVLSTCGGTEGTVKMSSRNNQSGHRLFRAGSWNRT